MGDLAGWIREFDERGFALLDQFVSRDRMDYFRDTLHSLVAKMFEREGIESSDAFHTGLVDLDHRNHARIHQIYNTIRRSDALCKIIFDDRLSELVKQLIGLDRDQLYYVWYQVCRIDPPKDERFLLSWHQESYSSMPNTRSAQIWGPAIDRNGPENGSIDVLVGSHRDGEIPHHLQEISPGYVSFYIPEKSIEQDYERITVELEPGDLVVFHPHLIHKSNSNHGDRVRYSLLAHYLNPYDDGFTVDGDDELIRYQRSRCVNADEFRELIDTEKQAYH